MAENEHTAEKRFWQKVEKTETCWLWTAGLNGAGYGSFWNGTKNVRAHRWLYEQTFGPLSPDQCLDHLCRVRHCVNPQHLEPVSLGVNVQRGVGPTAVNLTKTQCIHGHAFTPENTRITRRGRRDCRACDRRRSLRNYHRARMLQPGKGEAL